MKIDINELKPNLISFIAYELKECKLFWYKPSILTSLNIIKTSSTIAIPAYIAPSNKYIKKNRLNLGSHIVFTGERYGGNGIGTNGGGARCGNYNNLQYKGIGSNFLANSATNKSHTNGTLTLLDAITEVIYSEVLTHLLPVGVVKAVGLINTGEDTAYCNYTGKGDKKSTSGAILIRETCIRPAHFFAIPYYQPKGNDQNFDGATRIKNLHHILANKFSNFDEFAKYMGKMISLHACQFAFARIARISHGAVTPSNIALDGKWLDLNTVSFLVPNKNCVTSEQQIPFYQESYSINQIFQELIYTFCKYNNLNLSTKSLSSFYTKQLNQEIKYHTPWILGVDRNLIEEDVSDISQHIMKVLAVDSNIVFPPPYIKAKDSITLLVLSLFKSCFDNPSKINSSTSHINSNIDSQFFMLLKSVYRKRELRNVSFNGFLIQAYLTACKRSYFHQIFNRNRITELVIPMINSLKFKELSLFTDQITTASNWIFDDDHTRLTKIFNSAEIQITYDSITKLFEFSNLLTKEINTFNYAHQLKEFMQVKKNIQLKLALFDFKPDLIDILGYIHNV